MSEYEDIVEKARKILPELKTQHKELTERIKKLEAIAGKEKAKKPKGENHG